MPELPEVEIARENLERWLVGRRIRSARAPDRLLRGGQPRRRLESALEGARLRGVGRRGKFLVFDLGPRRSPVVAHLGMTGKFERVGPKAPLPPFVRVEMELGRGERVVLSDARRLGCFRLLDRKEEKRLAALGVEPLGSGFTAERLLGLSELRRTPIKLLLMDQRKIAGLGNIHAAEALFRARIHPRREARGLGREEAARLVGAIRRTLSSEIERSRAEGLSYLQDGSENAFLVYGRRGEPCPRCRTPIDRFEQGGRSSYYCPSCQREETGYEAP